jgi:hypothetical protein
MTYFSTLLVPPLAVRTSTMPSYEAPFSSSELALRVQGSSGSRIRLSTPPSASVATGQSSGSILADSEGLGEAVASGAAGVSSSVASSAASSAVSLVSSAVFVASSVVSFAASVTFSVVSSAVRAASSVAEAEADGVGLASASSPSE